MAPNKRSVVLIGGGHAHALVLNALKSQPLEDATVAVINPGKTAPYSGMLPGFVAGHYTRADLDIDLAALSKKVGASLTDGRAIGLDTVAKHVHLEDGTSLAYDIASIDVGITSRMDELPGFAAHGVPAKPLDTFSRRWDAFRKLDGPKHIAIIGGGIAGAELAMAMAFALRGHSGPVTVSLLDRAELLSANSLKTQKQVRAELRSSGVVVKEYVEVTEVTSIGVTLSDATAIEANFVVGAAGATPHAWVAETGLKLTNGFIDVNAALETSSKGVFAVGDCANMIANPRPKAGVYAVRQAPVLLRNIRHALSARPLEAYDPQTDYLKLVSLGGKRAFGEKKGWSAAGHLVWRVKDRIDRSFMDQF